MHFGNLYSPFKRADEVYILNPMDRESADKNAVEIAIKQDFPADFIIQLLKRFVYIITVINWFDDTLIVYNHMTIIV